VISPARPTPPTVSSPPLARIAWRLIPLLFVCYVVAYIDRINVGFAKLHLREALGVDERVFGSVYGLGAGLFFLGYFLFEVPSNLILQRVGARLWIARIMVVWGLVSGAMVFVNSGQLDAEASETGARKRSDLAAAFTSGRVWLLCLLYFLLNVGGYGYEMWLPSIVKALSGQNDFLVGMINAVPYGGLQV
jgi:MFS family permease